MADEEIAFQLMRLYRTLRSPADAQAKEAARREIDGLLRQVEYRSARPMAGADDHHDRRFAG
jgi:hypothetical protein